MKTSIQDFIKHLSKVSDNHSVKQEERMHEDVVVERYAINVSESVEKYKDVYGVKNNNQK